MLHTDACALTLQHRGLSTIKLALMKTLMPWCEKSSSHYLNLTPNKSFAQMLTFTAMHHTLNRRRTAFWVTQQHDTIVAQDNREEGKRDTASLVLHSDFSWLPFWKKQPGICCCLARITVSTCLHTVCLVLRGADEVFGPGKGPDKALKALSVKRQRTEGSEWAER